MITREIEFLRPTTAEEAVEMLTKHDGDVTIMSGGMSLMPMMNLGIVKPTTVMSLNHVDDLTAVADEGDEIRIGGMVRHRQVHNHDLILQHAAAIADAARSLGDVQVRNRGTIGGSVCHADPSADYLPVLTVLGADIELMGPNGTRRLPVEEFLIDVMYTAREPDEILAAISVPKQAPGSGASYVRFARVEGSFAIVNAAALVHADFSSTHVAIGGVGPKPVMIDASGAFADGITEEALSELSEQAYEASQLATGDVHSDAEYRRNMAGVFARRAVVAAAANL